MQTPTRTQLAEEIKTWIAQVAIAAHRHSPAQIKVAVEATEALVDALASAEAVQPQSETEPLSVEEVQELACKHADFDASYGGTYTFNADPECRFNIHEFAADVVREAIRDSTTNDPAIAAGRGEGL